MVVEILETSRKDESFWTRSPPCLPPLRSPPPTTFDSLLSKVMSLPKRIIKVSTTSDPYRVDLSSLKWPIRSSTRMGELTSASPFPPSRPSTLIPSSYSYPTRLSGSSLPSPIVLVPTPRSLASLSRLVVFRKPNDFSLILLLASPPLLMRRTSGISTS